MTKKLIIFDCDGVLVDSEFIMSKIFAETITSLGYSISTEESIKRFTGINAQDARQMILQESAIHIPETYWSSQHANLMKIFAQELTPLMRPVLDALEQLKVCCCVASNSSRKYIHQCLELTQQGAYFSDSLIFTAEQVTRAKPAPDLFLFAAQEMGFDPKNCMVVEDSPAGITAALAAGMTVHTFLGGSHARYDCYREKIDSFDVPMANNCQDLLKAIAQFLK